MTWTGPVCELRLLCKRLQEYACGPGESHPTPGPSFLKPKAAGARCPNLPVNLTNHATATWRAILPCVAGAASKNSLGAERTSRRGSAPTSQASARLGQHRAGLMVQSPNHHGQPLRHGGC